MFQNSKFLKAENKKQAEENEEREYITHVKRLINKIYHVIDFFPRWIFKVHASA